MDDISFLIWIKEFYFNLTLSPISHLVPLALGCLILNFLNLP